MGGIISVFLLALGLLAVAPVWAQDTADEPQIIEFDYDRQNDPPAVKNVPPTVNLPPTLETPPTSAIPAGRPESGAGSAAKSESVPAVSPTPQSGQAGASPTPEKVITIIGEPESPAAGETGAKPAASGPSDEELLDSLFGPAAKKPAEAVSSPAGAAPAASVPVPPEAIVERPAKAGPRTPAVSPLRPKASPAPSSIKVRRSSEVKAEEGGPRPTAARKAGAQAPERSGPAEAGFNPRLRAAIDPRIRPKPAAAAVYPTGRGLTRADFRRWELATYNWSLVSAGLQAGPLGISSGRPVVPINQAVLPGAAPRPANLR